MSGFVYIWYDKKHKRYYIGSHWGSENDGYICSSNRMRNAYNRRPQDFKRRIIDRVETNRVDLLEAEQKWLNKVKIKERYYNINYAVNNNIWWSSPEGRLSTNEKISRARKGKSYHPWKGKKLKDIMSNDDYSKYIEVLSQRATKQSIENNPFKGKHHSDKTKAILRQKALDKHSDPEYKEKILHSARTRDNSNFQTEEYKERKRIQSKINYETGKTGLTDNKGKNNGMYGKRHSDETKQKMSDRRQNKYIGKNNPMYGKTHTDEVKEKLRQSRLGKVWVFKDMITKSIPKEELETYIAQGWTKGRAMDKRASKNYILNNFLD